MKGRKRGEEGKLRSEEKSSKSSQTQKRLTKIAEEQPLKQKLSVTKIIPGCTVTAQILFHKIRFHSNIQVFLLIIKFTQNIHRINTLVLNTLP